MKKFIEEIYLNYLNDGFNDIVQPLENGEMKKKFNKLWEELNKNLTIDEQNNNCIVMGNADYETGLCYFTNGFRLGFMLCAEIFSDE